MNKKVFFSILALVILVLLTIFISTGILDINLPSVRDFKGWLPILVGSAALVDSINPCAFSVLFLTIAFLFSLGSLRNKIIKIGLVYILGIFLTYVLIGLGVLKVLDVFGVSNIMGKVGAVFIIVFGFISLLGDLIPNFPIKLKIPEFTHQRIAVYIEKASVPASFIMGMLVGLFEFPCTGGPYVFVLGLLHDQANFLRGLIYLIIYNLIFVLPLVVALFAVANKQMLETIDKVRRGGTKRSRVILSLIMIGLGALIFVL
jgi:cytochrome c-type biogenesis protein